MVQSSIRTLFVLLVSSILIHGCFGWNVAQTPPMGWNSWNYFGCGVDGDILSNIGKSMVSSGLSSVGYQYVNSDDCWMLRDRSSNGSQIANPDKFPNGFAAVTSYLHSIGLKSGLYTAKGPYTCAGFAASCDHEFQDAKQWADWGIDYVKDDSCSSCGNKNDNQLYGTMWQAIQASGRPMVLTVEGDPDDSIITKGGYGNAKRVGHDITPRWLSMVSLVDIASNLYPYAHNSTNSMYGGWWNDLDMIEIGNAPDFSCDSDQDSLTRCQSHMTMWCIMKSPLILGNDLRQIANFPKTLSVLNNKAAISVNQDGLGIQARRVALQTPKVSSIGKSEMDAAAVVAACDSSRVTQTWYFNDANVSQVSLYVMPCNSSDNRQQWSFSGGLLRNVGANACVDASGQSDPLQVKTCNQNSASQKWQLQSSGHIQNVNSNNCLDVYNFAGPDVQLYPCKVPGQGDSNQVWNSKGGMLQTAGASNMCLSAGMSNPGSVLSTVDEDGNRRCIFNLYGSEGGWAGLDCNTPNLKPTVFYATLKNENEKPRSSGHWNSNSVGWNKRAVGVARNYSLSSPNGSPIWNNQDGASGPWPHTRYLFGYGWDASSSVYEIDLESAKNGKGSTVVASDHVGILDDNLLGKITRGGNFCLDLVTGGMLEIWAAPLTSGRMSVALFNRSPASDSITLKWTDIGVTGKFQVYDIWDGQVKGVFQDVYTATVGAHATAFLILSPQ